MKKWMLNEIEYGYVYNKLMYPDKHREFNKIQGYWKWDVNDEYFDFLNKIEISESDLINPMVMSDVIIAVIIGSVHRKVFNESWIKTEDGHWAIPDEYDRDSLMLTGIIKFVKNDLLRQLCLCSSFGDIVKYGELRSFEKNQNIIDKYITNTHLKEQLIDFYSETKMRVENPEFNMQAVLMEISNTPARSVLDSILQSNKGKVIYADCWATWCGPCRSEIPYSKELMGKLKDSPVSFVFLCFDSEKKEWLKSIQESYLGGTHYFLSNESGEYFKKAFKVEAYPTYLLFDTKGNIRSYNARRPSEQDQVLVEIQKLIEEGAL
jgi:thiol-disulfide isomerase/thioredoxin